MWCRKHKHRWDDVAFKFVDDRHDGMSGYLRGTQLYQGHVVTRSVCRCGDVWERTTGGYNPIHVKE